MNNKLTANLFAFLLGAVVFATDLFSQYPSLDRVGISCIGGYIFLSLYHAWKFASPKISNLESFLVFWLFPLVLIFTVIWALLVGFVTSIPRLIVSFIQWRLSKKKATVGYNAARIH